MDFLERYLQAVGQYLPSAAREDTLAELRANLLEQMDAHSQELGRPLTEADVSAILLAHGRPEAVAPQYLPQRFLIGPGLFPTYLLTLRNVLPFVAFVYLIAKCILLIAAPTPTAFASVIVHAVLNLVGPLLTFWAVLTFVFALIEYGKNRFAPGKRGSAVFAWDPAKLPPVKSGAGPAKPKSIATRIADLTVHCLWTIYVLAIPAHPFIVIGPGV